MTEIIIYVSLAVFLTAIAVHGLMRGWYDQKLKEYDKQVTEFWHNKTMVIEKYDTDEIVKYTDEYEAHIDRRYSDDFTEQQREGYLRESAHRMLKSLVKDGMIELQMIIMPRDKYYSNPQYEVERYKAVLRVIKPKTVVYMQKVRHKP